MNLYLEIFFVAPESRDSVRYCRTQVDISCDMRNPDEIVFGMGRVAQDELSYLYGEHCIVHSTSWRYEYDNSVVLTYIVYSDTIEFRNTQSAVLPLKDSRIAHSGDPSRPRPDDLQEEHVLLHGLRHIGYLINSRSLELREGSLSMESRMIFASLGSALAGCLTQSQSVGCGRT